MRGRRSSVVRTGPAVAVLLLILFLPTACGAPAEADTAVPRHNRQAVIGVSVATFNVHYISPRQERMRWEGRRSAVLAAVRDVDADIVAFQEMETFLGGSFNRENRQLEYLRRNLPEYSVGATGDPAEYPSTQPIFYRASRFALMNQGYFFFSDTPDEIYSRSWDGRFPAFCSWVRLRDRVAGRTLVVYNVHFDAGSSENRRRASELVVRREARIRREGEASVIAGDFNAPWFFPTVRGIAEEGFAVANTRGPTYHFGRGIGILPAIDHVLHSSELAHRETRVLRKRYDGAWPSDHYPVAVELSYTPTTANR
jgi:endonuclease/exonuclease/phosphatase family metal-dependent hydrolase